MNNSILFLFCAIISLSWAEDYYSLLGVDRSSDQRDIRRAFKKLAVTEHPDKKTNDPDAHEKFIKLTTAYEVLKDPDMRKKYDLYGEEGLDNSNRKNNYHSYNYYQNNFGIYDDDPQIVTLNRNDYFDSVRNSEKMWIINFYSPMCGHCHTLAPAWRKVAKDLEGVIRVGAVNCEDDWQLCHQLGIQAYPTILHYPKNEKSSIKYTGEKKYDPIMRFVLDRLDVEISEISSNDWKLLLKNSIERPTLIFTCGPGRNCFDYDDRLKVAAIFDEMIDTKLFNCDVDSCRDVISETTGVVYLPPSEGILVKPVSFDDVEEVDELVKLILEQLPEPQDISRDEFDAIKQRLKSKSGDGWLLCFYIGHATDFDVLLKQLPTMLKDVNLAKINCGRYADLCTSLNVNHYPAWGVLKPGGAFEISHGKNTINDIASFAKSSLKAQNVWALSANEIHSILKRQNGDEAWFLDWYAPWCPPCMQFLPEVRKASMDIDATKVRFGTIDCTTHSNICRQYNIRSYPTAMLINGSNTHQFTSQRTASSIVNFIDDAMNPSVISLNSKNFNQKIVKKKSKYLWVVDYFAPWCGPCQQLAPQWTAVAKALLSLPNVKVANVNCETEASLCQSQGIRSYPSILLYPMGSTGTSTVSVFSGSRDVTTMLKWITSFLPIAVKELDDRSIRKEVKLSKDIVLVDYFTPWCGHCVSMEPQFAIAAQLLEGKAKLMKVNCDRYHHLCTEAGVRAYPTLILYLPKDEERQLYEGRVLGSSKAEGIREEVNFFVFPHSSVESSPSHDEL